MAWFGAWLAAWSCEGTPRHLTAGVACEFDLGEVVVAARRAVAVVEVLAKELLGEHSPKERVGLRLDSTPGVLGLAVGGNSRSCRG